MIDVKLVRESPELVKANMKKKFQDAKIPLVDKLVEKDKELRQSTVDVEKLRHQRNTVSKSISEGKKKGEDVSKFLEEAKQIPQKLAELDELQKKLKLETRELLLQIPNIIHESVPIGKDESENVEIKKIGEPKKFSFKPKNHIEIAENLGVVDFETSGRTSGAGFYFLKGDLALLNMALINFARDYMMKEGYQYVETPLMIRRSVLDGVFSNAEIEAMSYKIDGEDLYLIATSEHSLIGAYIGQRFEKKELPTKVTSYSMCFRKEIGSHGIEEKGLYRTHQFNKQEMIVVCEPEDSYKFYDEMIGHSIKVFEALEVPTRVLECCSGDLGDLKAKSADLEAWSPVKEEYYEICSVTNMEEAQARRLDMRVKSHDGSYFPHTLNNTVIATSRAMIAVLENNQNEDGSVDIPKALLPYMYGKKKLVPLK